MDRKYREDIDKYLQKFAVKGQEKLVNQLRQMLNPRKNEAPTKNGELKKSSSKEFIGRKKLFDLMDSFRIEAEKNSQLKEKNRYLHFELLCKPLVYPNNINLARIKNSLQSASTEYQNRSFILYPPENETSHMEINERQYDCIKSRSNNNDSSGFWIYVPESGIFYARNVTAESIHNKPDIFDPKVQSLTIAEAFIFLGGLYQNLGLNFRDKLDIVFRYSKASNLAVGSISPETFLPSVKYKKEDLTFYVVRELHELLGRTADMTAEIIIEILKKLRYQGIVNKDFFIHAISKHFAVNRNNK